MLSTQSTIENEVAGPSSTMRRRRLELNGSGRVKSATLHAQVMLGTPPRRPMLAKPVTSQHHLKNLSVSGAPSFDTVVLSKRWVAKNSLAAYNLSSGRDQALRSTW
mmetsp:Transcript_121620/g.338850  ORF Transcript_121620/g.338850 Transcript_121620/m.338850 type:complete len:106 (+) Transcript_121620:227-544(+)